MGINAHNQQASKIYLEGKVGRLANPLACNFLDINNPVLYYGHPFYGRSMSKSNITLIANKSLKNYYGISPKSLLTIKHKH